MFAKELKEQPSRVAGKDHKVDGDFRLQPATFDYLHYASETCYSISCLNTSIGFLYTSLSGIELNKQRMVHQLLKQM